VSKSAPDAASQPACHTPGPWEWDGHTLRPSVPDPSVSAVHSILEADGGHGFLRSKPSQTIAELDADRALIAAAPDLLAALTAITRRYRFFMASEGVWDDALQHAERAIAKAEGRA
jgi:hypothetical protein